MSFESKLYNIFEQTELALTKVDLDKANELLGSECSEFEEQQTIFNLVDIDKVDSDTDFYIYDPLKEKKAFDKNYHIMFMNSLDSWGKFPKRRNAIVAYSDKEKVNDDGVTFVAIPFNKTKLGIAPKENLDDCFNNVSINLGLKFELFNRSFNAILNIFNNPEGTYEENTKKLHLDNEQFYDESVDTLKKAISKADEMLSSDEGKSICDEILENPYNKETQENVISIIEYLKAKNISLKEMIERLFEPESNSFKFIGFKNFKVGEHKDKHVWFNNKCLLVRETEYNKLNFSGESDGVEEEPMIDDQESSTPEEE